jgi:hypothetical protein
LIWAALRELGLRVGIDLRLGLDGHGPLAWIRPAWAKDMRGLLRFLLGGAGSNRAAFQWSLRNPEGPVGFSPARALQAVRVKRVANQGVIPRLPCAGTRTGTLGSKQ